MIWPNIYEKDLGKFQLDDANYNSSKLIQDSLANQLLKEQELIIERAISNHLANWKISDLEGRLRKEVFNNGIGVYFLDDVAILEMHEKPETYALTKDRTTLVNAEVNYRFL